MALPRFAKMALVGGVAILLLYFVVGSSLLDVVHVQGGVEGSGQNKEKGKEKDEGKKKERGAVWKKKRRAVNPELCVLFISCNRPALLEKTLRSVYWHMQAVEPSLEWEAVLVDQATPGHTRRRFAEEYEFDMRVYSAEPRGNGWPYNVGIAGLCRAPYVALFEDDFPLCNLKQIPICRRRALCLELWKISLKALPGLLRLCFLCTRTL